MRSITGSLRISNVVAPLSVLVDAAERMYGVNMVILRDTDYTAEELMDHEMFEDALVLDHPTHEEILDILDRRKDKTFLVCVTGG